MQDQGDAYLRRPEPGIGNSSAANAIPEKSRTLVARVINLEAQVENMREGISKELTLLQERVSHLESFVGSGRIPNASGL